MINIFNCRVWNGRNQVLHNYIDPKALQLSNEYGCKNKKLWLFGMSEEQTRLFFGDVMDLTQALNHSAYSPLSCWVQFLGPQNPIFQASKLPAPQIADPTIVVWRTRKLTFEPKLLNHLPYNDDD